MGMVFTYTLTVAAEMSNPKDSYTLQLGINGDTKKPSLYKRPYAAIRDKYKWSKPGDHTLVAYDGKKGDYICLQTRFSVPHFDARKNVTSKNLLQFFFNGKQISVDQSFKTDADLRDVLSRMSYHGTYFTNVECTEHHLEYSGIVDGLPRDTSKEYVSWKGIVLCYMSVGGSAVITGKYKAVKPAFNGGETPPPIATPVRPS
ncbi:hypothetical protein HPB51_017299 [Rhipicephalus microplus]|uniref:Uncharacterized protein n=1 Tax=Rhipicephalus microplus TaxID=6941 RepID=A0A9J6EUB1_RHIMP|nr:hypothetical protein HPB51_017299 [Rhipicephalus microplus]